MPFKGQRGAAIPVLQKIQEEYGYLPTDLMRDTARFLGLTESDVFGVASFYAQFRFTPQGKNAIKVCHGTACHVRGSDRIQEAVEKEIHIASGETTRDRKFSLERVACFGSCALAPVMVVNKDVYGRMTSSKARDILAKY
jgi:NADH-quinone oxidoreductase E subunit